MNLCLSGRADCYAGTEYPSVVREAAAEVVTQGASAVTLNETCSGDAADIARRTGYTLRFAAIRYRDAVIPCVHPRGRGNFGLAVLTRSAMSASRDRAFAVQPGGEERRWLCASTIRNVTVCTAHLSTRDSARQRAANDAECRELRGVLSRRLLRGATVFGGDTNRGTTCAPASMWTTRDETASQAAGLQHIYGSLPLAESSPGVATATYSDHDFLFAAGHLPARDDRSPVGSP